MGQRHIVYQDRTQEYWLQERKGGEMQDAWVIHGHDVVPPISSANSQKNTTAVTLKDDDGNVDCYLVDVLKDLKVSSLLHWTFQSKDKEKTVIVLTPLQH